MYFLILLYVDKEKKDYRNVNLVGYWNTVEEAEAIIKNNWKDIHEYWCNSARIEFHEIGHLGTSSKKRWFYFTEDIETTPIQEEQPDFLRSFPNLFL